MLQPYIDLGFHTVPLSGELKRLEDGEKTIPIFPKDWRARFTKELNTKESSLGGAITGEVSNIIAIDCDNELTWKMFRTLDPDNDHVYLSRGKGYSAGTLIYKYTSELEDSFSINDGLMALDFYSNGGFVYLPTKGNKTKVTLTPPLPAIPDVPDVVVLLLKQLAKKQATPAVTTHTNVLTANCLAPLVKQFAETGTFMPGLFRIITPQSFRDLPQYVENNYLHPQDVPSGRGSEYLSKISAILGADISIDAELYTEAMTRINNLFDDPMNIKRLDSTILDPMINEQSSINGIPIWEYDKGWAKHRVVLQSKRQSNLEVSFDDKRNIYSVVDTANVTLRNFMRDSELMAYLEAATVSVPKKAEIKRSLPIANVSAHPNLPFGYNEGSDPTARILNSFIQSEYLSVFNNPEAYMSKYSMPSTTLKYMDTLMPNKKIRDYVLSFMHTKLKNFAYSPVILYFMGAHGSGKDVFVQLFELIIGSVARPTTKEFLEMFNSWILDQYFAQLDEYGNQLTNIREKEEALGKIKAYTGKRQVQIRQMRTDSFQYEHNITFIMTANKNPLMLEEGDRRICFISTPNVLADQDWVAERGGISKVIDRVFQELKDFCFYLATEVKPLSDSEYMRPPQTEDKHELIADSMYAAQRIAYAINHQMDRYLIKLAEEHNCTTFLEAVNNGGTITTDSLDELYDELTEGRGDERSFHKVLRQQGVILKPTTDLGRKIYVLERKVIAR